MKAAYCLCHACSGEGGEVEDTKVCVCVYVCVCVCVCVQRRGGRGKGQFRVFIAVGIFTQLYLRGRRGRGQQSGPEATSVSSLKLTGEGGEVHGSKVIQRYSTGEGGQVHHSKVGSEDGKALGEDEMPRRGCCCMHGSQLQHLPHNAPYQIASSRAYLERAAASVFVLVYQ